MINPKEYIKFSKSKLDEKFKNACSMGNLEIVKILLTASELKEHADIHDHDDEGFIRACKNGHLELVKYLLTSPELKEHANINQFNDYGFRYACENEHLEIVSFLIFDMNIEKTEHIEKHLRLNPDYKIENMFILRELNKDLEKQLNSDKINTKKRVKL